MGKVNGYGYLPGYGSQFTKLASVQSTGKLGLSDLDGVQKSELNSLFYQVIKSGSKVAQAETVLGVMSTKLNALKLIKSTAEQLYGLCMQPENQAAGIQAKVQNARQEANARLAAMNAYRDGATLFEAVANAPSVIMGGQSYSSLITVTNNANGFVTADARFADPADTEAGARAYAAAMFTVVAEATSEINKLQNLMAELGQAKQAEEQSAANAVEQASAVYENVDLDALSQKLEQIIESSARKYQLSAFLQARLSNWVQSLFNLNRA